MTSIRRRLTLNLCLGMMLLLGFGMGALYLGLREALTEQFDRALLAQLHDLDATLARGEQPRAEPPPPTRHHDAPAPWRFFVVRDRTGAVRYSDGSVPAADLAIPDLGHRPRFWRIKPPGRHPARAAGMLSRVAAPGAPLILVVGADLEELDEELGTIVAGILLAAAALLAFTVGIVAWALRRGLRPLATLAAEAARIEADSLDRRFPVAPMPAELQPIAARLNDLLARLQKSFARERRISADLAHELRTPLAELRLAAETALKWPESRTPETDRDVVAIAAHLESLTARMLELARSEDGRLAPVAETVELPALIERAWRAFAPRAVERRLETRFELAPVSATTDPVLLRSIVANLMDNAVVYTPAGGTVVVGCQAEPPGGVCITVANTTAGLDPADVAQFFERFWRKEAARTTSGHFGLGLALCRGFAGAMGWQISAAMDGPDRLTVALRGRISPPPTA